MIQNTQIKVSRATRSLILKAHTRNKSHANRHESYQTYSSGFLPEQNFGGHSILSYDKGKLFLFHHPFPRLCEETIGEGAHGFSTGASLAVLAGDAEHGGGMRGTSGRGARGSRPGLRGNSANKVRMKQRALGSVLEERKEAIEPHTRSCITEQSQTRTQALPGSGGPHEKFPCPGQRLRTPILDLKTFPHSFHSWQNKPLIVLN
ncbi:uncharacterized protein LOC118700441 [Molothrus ater]|uniref:uncharacterized protein LOC118700441 n=1 Tax=Molothrus ater TaxID=84834 RepID=UPI00174CC60F|nr:uncharacterized protein LOC118700441 [Molothrus ater]